LIDSSILLVGTQPHTYHFNNIWTNTLIIRLANLSNPPERHILTQHPYTIFVENNQDIIDPKNTIHTELYKFIHHQETPPTLITLQRKFPFLPEKLITESLRCLENINEYSHPPPLPNTPTPTPRPITNTNHETNIITWNASSLNTALPNLQSLVNNSLSNTAIINIQETKLTATKSTKYIQHLFPEYKLIFNNTHALTRCIQQRMPYTPGRGGLLTLIHNKYASPGNVAKIPTPANISPYLQIIKINNHPLLPWLIIHMYMPTHLEDTHLIPSLKTVITNQITAHPNHIHILCGDFNRDIALTGRQNNNNTTPPQEKDIQWKNFTTTLNLEYIPTNTNISRQGGYNYTSTSLIDGFYINSPNNNRFTSTTNTNMNLNSDHYPITLHIPLNMLIARPPPPINITPTRILNPIPPENLEIFNIEFFEANSTQLNELTSLLENHNHLTHNQWQDACITLDNIIEKISIIIEKTCKAAPIPTLTNRTAQQGGFLHRKLSKEWKNTLIHTILSEKPYTLQKTIQTGKLTPS
jgi:exonuclease III